MLNHSIFREACGCRIRPLKESDGQDVLTLWNQDWVIGTLWSSATSEDTYRSCFERYKVDPNVYQCVVEKANGEFVGTVGFEKEAGSATFGFFALYPNRGFRAAVPCILLFDYILNAAGIDSVVFTCNVKNERAEKVYEMLRAERTGIVDTVVSRYGVSSTREHWKYDCEKFNENREYFKISFGVELEK